MSFPSIPRVGALLTLLPLNQTFAAEGTPPWHEVSQYDFGAAHGAFSRASGRDARLGEAVTLLNLQPHTAANVDQAAVLLDQIAAAKPDDELGFCARYLRARLEEIYRPEPRPAEAARRYAELIATGGKTSPRPAGGRAFKPAQALPRRSDAPGEECVAAAEALGAGLTDSAAIRDHELLVGRACLYYGFPLERARGHLERALTAGVLNSANRADLLVTLGEIARELGDKPGAERAYRAYLAENPRADRSGAVRRRLAELAALPTPAESHP